MAETIREATPADKSRLVEMAVRFLLESPYGQFFDDKATPDSIGTLIDNVLVLGTVFVAERQDKAVVGMLAIVALPHPLTGRLYAEEIAWWVEPEHRGGLLGPKMLRVAEEWATRKGANMIKMVAPTRGDVGRFYEVVGYQAVETAYFKRI